MQAAYRCHQCLPYERAGCCPALKHAYPYVRVRIFQQRRHTAPGQLLRNGLLNLQCGAEAGPGPGQALGQQECR